LSSHIKVPRCIHRHTIEEHPSCFVQGLIKGVVYTEIVVNDALVATIKSPEVQKVKIPWYQEPGFKVGYLDIESDGLRTDFSTMLTWSIKDKGGPVYHDSVTRQELFDLQYDERIVKSLIDKLREYKIIVTYYGTGFDIPFIRTKALHYGIEFPSYADLTHFDIYYTVKSKLNLSRKSLDNACDYLGIVGKTPLDKEVWRRAKYGDPGALAKVLEHNVADVAILEELHQKMEPFAKWMKRSL
jgi:uncharacterized protein YprB with RNaseH-like and TPR domain